MLLPSYSISPTDLWNSIATPQMPQIIDVRRHDVFTHSPHLLPGAVSRESATRFAGRPISIGRVRSSSLARRGTSSVR